MKLIPREPQATADISSGRTSGRQQVRTAVLFLVVVASIWWLLGVLGGFIGARIPDRWERQLAGTAGLLDDPELTNQLDRAQAVLARLTDGESLRALDYRLFLIDLDAANAVAVPGGGIGVTTELLEAVTSEEGLAFVLAHELGHHQRRHITRRLGRGLLQALVLGVVFGRDDVGVSAQSLAELAESGYSRADEREADDFALRLVHRKYGASRAALDFFRHVVKAGGDPRWQNFVGTHPATGTRIAEMESLLAELEKRAPSSVP